MAPSTSDSLTDKDTKELFAEQFLEALYADFRASRGSGRLQKLDGLFVRAVNWFAEYEEWGDAAFPNEPKLLREQPWEWVKSVEAVKAARRHFDAYMKAPPEGQMASEEGGIGRGAVG